MRLFARKPIAELVVEGESPYALKRALGAGDLIMLAICAVIGAGIFGEIGTAAAGQYDAAGHLVRRRAGTALLSPDPALHGLLQGAPHVADIPILVNLPAFVIVMLITWLLMLGVRESATANNIMVTIKLLVLGLFVIAGLTHLRSANLHPFAPNGFRGIHQGAAIVFFAYIGFDAISTAAEETKNPQRNLPIGILGGLAICTLIYMIVGAVLTGMVPYTELGVADPLAKALNSAGFTTVGWIVALGAIISMSAVLLVFQYGQPRIFFAMGRDGLLPAWAAKISAGRRVPYITTIVTGVFVAVWSL